MMEDSESAFIITLLFLFLIWFAISFNKEIWVYINRFMLFIEDFFAQDCLPKVEIPIWSKISDNPCASSPATSAQNVINITCGSGTAPCDPKAPCNNESKPPRSSICPTICGKQTEVSFGCFKYIIDQLPGLIYKYQLDNCGQIIEDSRIIITHTFGILKKISVNAGRIVVEDSYSIEHTAIVDPVTGMLTF